MTAPRAALSAIFVLGLRLLGVFIYLLAEGRDMPTRSEAIQAKALALSAP